MSNKRRGSFRIRTPEIVLAFLILLSGIWLGFSSGGFIINFKTVGFTVFSSMQKGVHAVSDGVVKTFTSIGQMARLQKEYDALVEQLKDYEYLQRNNSEIRKENDRLREQLDFAERNAYKNYAAQIIGRDTDGVSSGITIDKGTRHGIKKGMPVIAIQNGNIGLVGRITTVGAGTSIIMPIYDFQCNVSSRIQNTRDIGLVQGNGSSDSPLSMLYIRKRLVEDFNYGDFVVTSGENGNYMRDIPIGTISKITVLDYDSSLEIELTPVIDFARLETVLVVDIEQANDRGGEN